MAQTPRGGLVSRCIYIYTPREEHLQVCTIYSETTVNVAYLLARGWGTSCSYLAYRGLRIRGTISVEY